MSRLSETFRSLSQRNYRLWFIGQLVSHSGTWMQRVGQEWLVLDLTGSGTWLGIVAALQFLPMLVVAPWGGLLADRVDKHRMIVGTQFIAGLLALVLGVIVVTGIVQVWMVCVLAACLGLVSALDNPGRQSIVLELVGPADVQNAVTLNSVVSNTARAIGPALAGVVIVGLGLAAAFFINAASFLVVLAALWLMDTTVLARSAPVARSPGQLRDGLRHVWRTPVLRSTLLLLAVAGVFAYEWAVTLPLMARYVFDGDARTLGALNAALGAGAVVGGLAAAGRGEATQRTFMWTGMLFGALLIIVSMAPTLTTALIALALTGGVSIQFLTTGNSLLQLHAGAGYRGRVMSLWSVAFLGTTPVGALIVGTLGEFAGGRAPLLLGGAATMVASTVAVVYVHPTRRRPGESPSASLTA